MSSNDLNLALEKIQNLVKIEIKKRLFGLKTEKYELVYWQYGIVFC
mgnify:CR=1 FL=1